VNAGYADGVGVAVGVDVGDCGGVVGVGVGDCWVAVGVGVLVGGPGPRGLFGSPFSVFVFDGNVWVARVPFDLGPQFWNARKRQSKIIATLRPNSFRHFRSTKITV
jgi:hypothetical protein